VPLVAEVTTSAVRDLHLEPGTDAWVAVKATESRSIPRSGSWTGSKGVQISSNRRPCLADLLVGNLVSTMAETLTEQEALDVYSTIVSSVAEAVLPSVASLRIGRGGGRGFGGAGSGVVITPDGFLVTSAHVVAAGGAASASFIDGTEHDVDVVGADPLSDLAVARARTDSLHPSDRQRRPAPRRPAGRGDRESDGFSGSVNVRGRQRVRRSLATADGNGNRRFIEDVIQTDAALNPATREARSRTRTPA